MLTAALPETRLNELNRALAVEVRATRNIVSAARRLGATILVAHGDSWLCQFADGRACLWRATDKDEAGELDEFDGFDGQIGAFGHRHVCLNCQETIEDEVFDCPVGSDHAPALCEACRRAGVRPKDPEQDVLLMGGSI